MRRKVCNRAHHAWHHPQCIRDGAGTSVWLPVKCVTAWLVLASRTLHIPVASCWKRRGPNHRPQTGNKVLVKKPHRIFQTQQLVPAAWGIQTSLTGVSLTCLLTHRWYCLGSGLGKEYGPKQNPDISSGNGKDRRNRNLALKYKCAFHNTQTVLSYQASGDQP